MAVGTLDGSFCYQCKYVCEGVDMSVSNDIQVQSPFTNIGRDATYKIK